MAGFVVPTTFVAHDKFSATLNRFDRQMRKISRRSFDVGRSFGKFGLAVATPLGLAVNEAVKFEDQMADVAKTTGKTGKELEMFGKDILNLSRDTRTSVEDLTKIAEIGGQLGVTDGLLEFVKASDQFNVALGGDFQGGVEEAVSQVGKLKNLFAGTRDLAIDQVITKAGSAINFLGAKGAGTSANITDFTLRLGALPDALKPTIQNTLALGTFLEEVGISSERGASGLGKFLLVASRDLGSFSKQIGISQKEAKVLLQTDPTEFAKRFAKTFEGLPVDKLGKRLKTLGLNSQEAIKVIGALSTGTQRLTKLQEFSNDAFADGTSLLEEFNTKNNTTVASFSKVRNQIKATAITLGTSLIPSITKVVESVTPLINKFSQWIQDNPRLTTNILKTVGAISALSLGISGLSFLVGGVAKGLGALSQVGMLVGGLTSKLKTFNAVMKVIGGPSAGTIGLAIAGATALYLAYDNLNTVYNRSNRALEIGKDVQKTAMLNTVDQRIEVNKLFKALEKSAIGSLDYNKALGRLEEIQPGVTKQFNLQSEELRNLSKAYDSVTDSILKQAKAEAALGIARDSLREAEVARIEGPSFLDKAIEFSQRQALAVGTFGASEAFGFGEGAVLTANEINQDRISGLEDDARTAANLYEQTVNPRQSFLSGLGQSIQERVEIVINNNSDSEVTTNTGGIAPTTSSTN